MNPEPTGRRSRAGVAVLVAVVYFAAAELGLSLAYISDQVSAVWPPTGIALAAVLRLGRSAAAGVLLGATAANLASGAPLPVALGIAAGNTLEALAGAWILGRLGFRPSLDRLRDALALIAGAAGASTTLSATVGVTALCVGGLEPWALFPSLWGTWWIGDAMGNLVMAPLLLAWSVPPLALGRPAETAALVGVTLLVSLQVFTGQLAPALGGYPLHYAIFPCVIWAALRLGPRGATAVVFVASATAIGATVLGLGPFAPRGAHESLVLLQLYMAVVAGTGLLLAATIAERDASRDRAAADLAALETGELRLRLALDAAQLGVWDWDVARNVVWWSDNLESIHGLAPGTFPGTLEGFRDLVHPDDRARVDEAIRGALERGEPYDLEFQGLGPDGATRWIATRAKVLRGRDGSPAHMLGTARDVSERRRLLDDLESRAKELAAADHRKNEFLAMLAHELRNPLAPLRTSLELLARDPEGRERHLETASRQVRHLIRLIDDLLDVSRITRGKIALERAPVLLEEVVSRALEIAGPALSARGHTVRVDLPPAGVLLEADAVRLTQVFANLLGNAATYTPPGGTVTLEAGADDAEVVVRVRDSGIGIPADLLPRIFDLFVQGDASLDRARGGLGIGLTLVRSLVELHGGRIEAHSAGIGQGSEFVVHLPRAAAHGRAAAGQPVEPEGATRVPCRVLVVEDNRDSAESLAALLELERHEVRIALDGAAALELAREFRPDVVISDLGLPGMDGFALARAIREDRASAGAVLIALSGYGREEDRRRALEAGYDHHLAKPADLAALLALVAPSRRGPAGEADRAAQLGKARAVP